MIGVNSEKLLPDGGNPAPGLWAGWPLPSVSVNNVDHLSGKQQAGFGQIPMIFGQLADKVVFKVKIV
jgi:hypothetical protein